MSIVIFFLFWAYGQGPEDDEGGQHTDNRGPTGHVVAVAQDGGDQKDGKEQEICEDDGVEDPLGVVGADVDNLLDIQ